MSNISGGNALINAFQVLSISHVSEGIKVADLGCGTSGHFVFQASTMVGKKGKVYAVDILKTTLETISKKSRQENFENVITVWSDLEVFGATRIEPGSVDVVLLVNTLFQSTKRAEIMREAVRLLKKGGRLTVVEWKSISLPLGPPPEERVKIDFVVSLGKKNGLDIVEEFEAGQYHYGVVFIKM